jgi:hypothetical protein
MPQFKSLKVRLKLPYVADVEGTWEPDERERDAAWELYVELVTRVSVVELGPKEGLLREALGSLYSLFQTTREILRKYGPGVARPKGGSELSFGYLAVAVLNGALRPVLANWHPLLLDYEGRRPPEVSAVEHEWSWERAGELRQELERVRGSLVEYADLLAEVAEVPLLRPHTEGRPSP